MILLDGKVVREERSAVLKHTLRELGFTPVLAIVHIGSSARSRAYINQKKKFAEAIGIGVELFGFNADVPTGDVLFEIKRLNEDPSITGIIVQLPLPKHADRLAILESIDPTKDVDGLTARNLKLLMENNRKGFMPATAKGVLSLIDHYRITLEGKLAVIVGRSLLVGKPTALAFLNRNATVTVCHSFTRNLPAITKQADILVTAVGEPRLIGKEHVRAGQVVVDVGITVHDGEKLQEELSEQRLLGDVDFEAVRDVVKAISPVPGGVGPMTVLSLFENVIEAASRQNNLSY